ncbi:MAG: hypothetical protein ACR2ND_16100 [Solirubrobacteraceae bacterium]
MAELQAIRSRQQAGERVDPVIVLAYAPAWAAAKAGGCEKPGAGPASRPLNQRGFDAYQTLIRQILSVGLGVGIALPYWSPWNEPNHPTFMTQRQVCQRSAPAISPQTYSALTQAMQRALAGSSHRLIIGELAGFQRSSPTETSVSEFIAALPSALICQSSIFAVHDYFGSNGRSLAASTAAVSLTESALAAKGSCGSRLAIWVTESGSGSTRRTTQVAAARARACGAFAAALGEWYRDPRVRAVFQYTFREDPLFPIGLYSNSLYQRFPSYSLLASWARNPGQPPSAAACHG